MWRKIGLFGAVFFTGLVAGAAFIVWIEFNPAGLSAAYYTESMQHAIRDFTIPLPSMVGLSILCTGAMAIHARHARLSFYLLAAACLCTIVVAFITVFGNIPINNEIKHWTSASPPSNWPDVAAVWWRFQSARLIVALGGFVLAIWAALNREAT